MVLETVHFEAVAAAVGSFLAMPAFLFGPKVLDVLESSLVDDPDGSNKAALLFCFAPWTSISGILRMRDPSRESSSTPTIWGRMGLTTRCLLSCNDLVLGDVPHIGMDPPLRDRTQLFWSLNPPHIPTTSADHPGDSQRVVSHDYDNHGTLGSRLLCLASHPF